jgi:hypothetical protein
MKTKQKERERERQRFFNEKRQPRIGNRNAKIFLCEAAIGFIAGFATGYMKYCSRTQICTDLSTIPYHMPLLYSFIPLLATINMTGYQNDNGRMDLNDHIQVLKNTVTPYMFGIICGGLCGLQKNTHTDAMIETPVQTPRMGM